MADDPIESTPVLAVRDLHKSFAPGLGRRRRPVLAGVDLELPAGRNLGLVGSNGSGKSTLLRIIAGIERASAGEVRVFGQDPRARGVRARIGFLPETSPFPHELQAREVLDLLGSLSGMTRIERHRRADEMLARVGLAENARQRLGTFSQGMLRRFGLAQAFLHTPELVLLDEPTAGLDAEGYAVLSELLREAGASGATVVICSHQFSDLAAHTESLVVLIQGRVASLASPEELLHPDQRLVLELEGVSPVTLRRLESWLAESGGRIVARHPAPETVNELYRELGRREDGA